ncbi:MAG: hypothetical protein A3F11_00085 [Gammaproteobacteria bacterium RIFCSPHIGHO2_12_FULL_37_14]|nr:MAG: hypothetical protein A3F11_00085 [Gammaproteobacteria bacterium RIFCSPHIGHO2_12_FULL_37_14]
MVEINLFPWREHKQLYEKKIIKQFFSIALSFSMVIIIAIHFHLSHRLNDNKSHITILQNQLAQYERLGRLIQRDEETNTMQQQFIKSFLNYQKNTAQLFNILTDNPPFPVCFSNISRHQHSIIFNGYVRSTADLADFLIHWQAAELFSEVKVERLKRSSSGPINFSFKAIEKIKFL